MKVIQVLKTYSNGTVTKFLVVPKTHSNDEVDDVVNVWAEEEPSGHSRGYETSWEEVSDKAIINDVLEVEIAKTRKEIISLTKLKAEMRITQINL